MSLLPLLVVLALVGAVALGAVMTRPPAPTMEATVAAARRHARKTSWVAVGLGLVAAVVTAATSSTLAGGLGVTILQTPVVYAVVHTLVLAIGELTWPRPAGEVRRARLVRRGVLDAAPRRLLQAVTGAAVVAAVTVTAGGLLAGPDGRSFTYTLGDGGEGTRSWSSSPFPGWFYGRPAAIGLLLMLVVALATLWIVATRPAVATRDDRVESALRRASAHRVLRAVAAALLLDTGGLVFITGTAVPDAAPGPFRALGAALAVVGVGVVLAGALIACLRAPDVPADAPVPAG